MGQGRAKRLQVRGAFRHFGSRIYHSEAGRIHHRKHAFPVIQKGAIEDQVACGRELARQGRRLLQPMRNDSMERPRAVATLGGQLTDGVALHNPAFEPHEPLPMLVGRVLPHKGPSADGTIPARFALATGAMPLNPSGATLGTRLFCSSQHPYVERVQYKEAKHTMNKGPYANFPNTFWHLFQE